MTLLPSSFAKGPLAVCFAIIAQFLCFSSIASANADPQLDEQIDIRILVDVSGSMKKTDPLNLRVPALQVLTQLLPQGAQAGVWEFAEDSNMVVAHGSIDEHWRQQALAAAAKVRSDGQFTDIGGALQAAAFSAQAQATERKLHVILLTDGMVDVAKNEVVNIRARNELLQHTTQAYVDAGALVHAIGLSHAADEKTLSDIARRTDGLFAVAENADQLLDIFLRALDNSVLTQQAPVAADRQSFVVNGGAQSITVVVEKHGDEDVSLQSPDGEVISPSSKQQAVEWKESSTHDVVTVQEPEQGTWTVASADAEVTRVNVQGQLRMDLRLPSNNLYLGQVSEFSVSLADDKGAITDAQLLSEFVLQLSLFDETNQLIWREERQVSQASTQVPMPAMSELGLYRLQAQLTHGEQVQQVERSLRVHPPVDYRITQQQIGNAVQYQVIVEPIFKQLDLDNSHVTATAKRADGTSLQKAVPLAIEQWQAKWLETQALAALGLRLEGRTLQGQTLVYAVDAAEVKVLTPKQVAQQQQAQSVAVEDLPEAKVIEVQVATVEETAQEEPLQVSEEAPTAAMQELMQPEAAEPEPSPVQQEPASKPPVVVAEQVEVESTLSEPAQDNRSIIFAILILVLIATLIWARLKKKPETQNQATE